MARYRKFERKIPRPTLAASLEAARQGRVTPVAQEEPETLPSPQTVPAHSGSDQALGREIKRIGIILVMLFLILVALSGSEARGGILTNLLRKLLNQ